MTNYSSVLKQLKRAASDITLRSRCPVYAVGSFLNEDDKNLDIDIIMVISEYHHKVMFGCTPEEINTAWANHNLTPGMISYAKFLWKQKCFIQEFLVVGLKEVDFKIQTEEEFAVRSQNKKFMRLDMFEEILPGKM